VLMISPSVWRQADQMAAKKAADALKSKKK
jgi:hypothetical protein